MRFSCEGCDAKYMISDDKVGPGGVKVRCKKCGHVTLVRRSEPEGAAAHGGIVGRRVVGGHRRPAGRAGRDRRGPAPLGPGRDRSGEPGLVLRDRRVGPHRLRSRAARAPGWRHARGAPGPGPSGRSSSVRATRSGPRGGVATGSGIGAGRAGRAGAAVGPRAQRPVRRRTCSPGTKRRPRRRLPPRAPASEPTPPASFPCPWPGWSGPGRGASTALQGPEARSPGAVRRTRPARRAARSPRCFSSRWWSWAWSPPASGG